MYFYSIIIPVYNRSQEVDELLSSLTEQSYANFEVVIVEDGSENTCKLVVDKYADALDITYYFKENAGQGFARNYGFERAKGDYFIVFDSDCLIPANYLELVDKSIQEKSWDAFGGPDKEHESFTLIQKAISYSMTSPFTTGGIRGNKNHTGTFHPRSFNMGISKAVFAKTNGYKITRMGEDIEFSIRIIESGFKVGLIFEAFVYHKRRTNLWQFYKQLYFFGRARINISRFYPKELKLVHTFPALFLLGWLILPSFYMFAPALFKLGVGFLGVFYMLIFVHSSITQKNLLVGVLSILTATIQLLAYGVGFVSEGVKKIVGAS
ncbi:MAG: glycosyltransferase [Cyclobacteriaceae bacterium]|nr:glycosyltransferase [Cyclobacteriaceae bacterium]